MRQLLLDQSDPSIILMVAVFGIADDANFKISLKQDPSMDLAEFFHEVEMFLRLKNA